MRGIKNLAGQPRVRGETMTVSGSIACWSFDPSLSRRSTADFGPNSIEK
jgi:hypothetical protein